MEFPIYQVDAFTSDVFKGNPAAVVPLQKWLPDDVMQNIALENNLAETAFFIPDGDGFHLRWFTPTVEVDLCGHATLATSWVIYNVLNYDKDTIKFKSLSGDLIVYKSANGLTLDFPIWKHTKVDIDERITDALGHKPDELYHGPDWLVIYNDPKTIENMNPDMSKLSKISECRGVIATAKTDNNNNIDFVSRWFGPNVGVPEDPVTGSAHCILTPIWAEKLGKTKLKAYQASPRGGYLDLELKNDRVYITGQATLYMKGTIYI